MSRQGSEARDVWIFCFWFDFFNFGFKNERTRNFIEMEVNEFTFISQESTILVFLVTCYRLLNLFPVGSFSILSLNRNKLLMIFLNLDIFMFI